MSNVLPPRRARELFRTGSGTSVITRKIPFHERKAKKEIKMSHFIAKSSEDRGDISAKAKLFLTFIFFCITRKKFPYSEFILPVCCRSDARKFRSGETLPSGIVVAPLPRILNAKVQIRAKGEKDET